MTRPTSSTISTPPLNHLYLLIPSFTAFSTRLVSSRSPRDRPARLGTTQARGTSSSFVLDECDVLTPATATSVISGATHVDDEEGERRNDSSSEGDNCIPEILSVSLLRSAKLISKLETENFTDEAHTRRTHPHRPKIDHQSSANHRHLYHPQKH